MQENTQQIEQTQPTAEQLMATGLFDLYVHLAKFPATKAKTPTIKLKIEDAHAIMGHINYLVGLMGLAIKVIPQEDGSVDISMGVKGQE